MPNEPGQFGEDHSSTFDDQVDDALKAMWQGRNEALDHLLNEDGAPGTGIGGFLKDMMDAPAGPAPDRSLPAQIGRYQIIGELGRGGMGVIYEARQQQPERSVALKVIRSSRYVNEDYIRLFHREIQTLARLNHPNIAAIYEAGCTDDGEHFFAMELIRGVPLLDYIWGNGDDIRQTPLSTPERLQLFVTVCQAIGYAHQRGVIHRDLKPSNILIDAAGNPKILDFGLARITDTDVAATTIVTQPGRIIGTLTYMSPEQARGKSEEIDVRSDVYSLGVILYQMVAAQLPYDVSSSSLHEAVRSICETTPPSLHRLDRNVSDDLSTIVMKTLEKEPARRYSGPLALAEDIERYLTGHPIIARPPTMTYQLRKLIGRHKAPFAFLATLFVLVTGVAIWMTVLYGESNRQRRLAEANLVRAEAAERDARTEAKKAERISTFLQDMLSAADPERTAGRDMTVYESVKRAAQTVDTAFADEPEVDAAVRSVIGTTFRNLGRYAEGEAQLRTALTTARALYEQAPKRHQRQLARTMLDLGRALVVQDKFEEAESLYQQGTHLLREASGDDHPDTIRGRAWMAMLRWRQGRYAEAQLALRAVHSQLVELLGENHADTIAVANDLALILNDRGKYGEAEPLFRALLESTLATVGEAHPQAGRAYNNLAWNLHRSGKYVEAESFYRKAIEVWDVALGEDHPETTLGRNNLGRVLTLQGKFAEAEVVFREALDINRRVLGEEHTQTAGSYIGLGWTLHELGGHREAETLVQAGLAILQKTVGNENHLTAHAYEVQGRGLILQERFAEAESPIRRALKTREALLDENHPDTVRLYNELAFVLSKQDKYDEAEPLFRKALEAYIQTVGEEHHGTLAPMHNLASILEKQDKIDEAIAMYRKVLGLAERVLPEGHWNTAVFHGSLGSCLTLKGKYEEAEEHLLAAIEGLSASLGTEHSRTQHFRQKLAALYESKGRPDEAARYNAP